MSEKYYALIGRLFSYAGQFIIIATLPLALTPELFAKYNLVMPVLTLGSSVFYGWLNGAAFRWSHKVISPKKNILRNAIFFYYATLLALSALLSIGLMTTGRTYEALLPLTVFAISIKDYFLKLSNACEDYTKFALGNAFFLAGKILFVAVLYFLQVKNIEVILVLFLISELFFVIPFVKLDHRRRRTNTKVIKKALQSMLSYGGPLISASIAVWVMSLSDRYILALFTNQFAVANYVLVYQFAANAITIPLLLFITIYFPTLLKIEREQGLDAAMQHNKIILKKYYFIAPLYALTVSVAIYAALKLFYHKYQADPWLIGIMMAAQLLYGATHFYNKKYELDNRTHLIAIAVLIAALIDVGFNFLLVPTFGAIGAASSALISYACLILITLNFDLLINKSGRKLTVKAL